MAQRDKAIEYLDKSLDLTRGYGEAQALKLEIFAMDFVRGESDEAKKNKALEHGRAVFDEILNSQSPAPALETMNRLKRDYVSQAYKKYVDTIDEIFTPEMAKLEEKVKELNLLKEQMQGI